MNWPEFLTVLLQIQFNGGIAVEHEDEFWDAPNSENLPDFPQQRKDGFILARRFLGQFCRGGWFRHRSRSAGGAAARNHR